MSVAVVIQKHDAHNAQFQSRVKKNNPQVKTKDANGCCTSI